MARISDRSELTPVAEVPPALAVPPPQQAHKQPALVSPEVLLTPSQKRPESVQVKAELDRRAHELRSLATVARGLAKQPALSAQDALQTLASQLKKSRNYLSSNDTAARETLQALSAWTELALTSTPSDSASSIVTERWPDPVTVEHGAFKTVAKALDTLVVTRRDAARAGAEFHGFFAGELADKNDPAQQAGKADAQLSELARPVLKATGTAFSHESEVNQALNCLLNARKAVLQAAEAASHEGKKKLFLLAGDINEYIQALKKTMEGIK